MDNSKQVYVSEVTGWQRGIYEDIKQTTGMVGTIWRTLMYHEPRFLRYMWGQVKPVFQTREFAAFERTWRDTLLSAVEDDLPKYDVPANLNLEPDEFTELRNQLSCFCPTAPRYFVTFKLLHRRLHDNPVGIEPASEAGTTPFPERLDHVRGCQPIMLPQDEARQKIPESLAADFGEMLPTEYRSMAQWPSYVDPLAEDLKPVIESDAYETARKESISLVDTYLDRIPYTPQIDPDSLADMDFDEETITELQDFSTKFERGGCVLMPLLPLFAETVGVAAERRPLTF